MIGRLQRIKDLRLERAEQQLTAQQARLQLARIRQREAEQESLDYRQWRQAEEERLFAICQAEQLDRKGLKAWQQQVALLREKEAHLEQLAAEPGRAGCRRAHPLAGAPAGGTPRPPAAAEICRITPSGAGLTASPARLQRRAGTGRVPPADQDVTRDEPTHRPPRRTPGC